jgi:hypothetical protein
MIMGLSITNTNLNDLLDESKEVLEENYWRITTPTEDLRVLDVYGEGISTLSLKEEGITPDIPWGDIKNTAKDAWKGFKQILTVTSKILTLDIDYVSKAMDDFAQTEKPNNTPRNPTVETLIFMYLFKGYCYTRLGEKIVRPDIGKIFVATDSGEDKNDGQNVETTNEDENNEENGNGEGEIDTYLQVLMDISRIWIERCFDYDKKKKFLLPWLGTPPAEEEQNKNLELYRENVTNAGAFADTIGNISGRVLATLLDVTIKREVDDAFVLLPFLAGLVNQKKMEAHKHDYYWTTISKMNDEKWKNYIKAMNG